MFFFFVPPYLIGTPWSLQSELHEPRTLGLSGASFSVPLRFLFRRCARFWTSEDARCDLVASL